MIKNFIFDMGNVLICFYPTDLIARLGITGEDAATLKKIVFEGPDWPCLDDGSLTEPEVVEVLKKKLPERLHAPMAELVQNWDKPIISMPGMSDIIKDLKEQGYKIYLLSNTSRRVREYWPRINGSEYFDGGVASADVMLVKPDKKIYETLFSKYDLKPEECFFIDDNIANIEAARSLNMQGFVFQRNIEELKREIAKVTQE